MAIAELSILDGTLIRLIDSPAGFTGIGDLAWTGHSLLVVSGSRIGEIDLEGNTLRSIIHPTLTLMDGIFFDGRTMWVSDLIDDVVVQMRMD